MSELLERDSELAAIDAQLDRACEGSGSLIVVEGPAGMGKTALLREAVAKARAREMTVLSAKGGVLEQRLEFGIARQLVERPLLQADDERRARLLAGPAAGAAAALGLAESPPSSTTPGHDPLPDILHGLYWVVANLSEEAPVLMIVDDAQWGDVATLRAGGYLARRLADLRVAFIVGVRADEPGRQVAILAEQLRATEPTYLSLKPLTRGAVGTLLAGTFGDGSISTEVVEACESASGGNPFYLTELALDLAGRHPTAADLRADAVAGADPPAVRRAILLRLGQLGADCRNLARALAILGGEGELRHAAAIAELEPERAATAADALAVATIIEGGRPLRITHPLVRGAINDDMTPSGVAALHRRAYEVLAADGVPDEALLAHALEAEPIGDPELTALLIRTAGRALSAGAADTARFHLDRALAEPPLREDRAEVLAALGRAELRDGSFAEGLVHLREALALRPATAAERVEIYRDQALAAFASGGVDAAREVVANGLADTGADEGMQLEADLALLAWLSGAEHGLALERHAGVAGETRAERTVLALLSQERLARGAPAAEGVDFALRALGGGRLIAEDTSEALSWYLAVYSLLICEAHEEARATIAEALADGRSRGSAFSVAGALGARAVLALNEGRPGDAEVDALTAAAGGVPLAMAGVNSAYLVLAHVEQGDLEAADEQLEAGGIASGPGGPTVLRWVPWARGRLREAQGRVADVRDAVEPLAADDASGGAMRSLAWRALLSRTLSRAGEGEEAAALAATHLGWAESWGRPAALGVAQRAHALSTDGDRRIELLEAAVATLGGSSLRTEEARARADLGIALLRAGRRGDGTRELQGALDGAMACGAKGTARLASGELEIAGAAPRKLRFDELTASERRVAELAAAGGTNREIAAELYVTPKTVENHLTRVYSKLGIESRADLAGAL